MSDNPFPNRRDWQKGDLVEIVDPHPNYSEYQGEIVEIENAWGEISWVRLPNGKKVKWINSRFSRANIPSDLYP